MTIHADETTTANVLLDGPLVMNPAKAKELRNLVQRAEHLAGEAEALGEDRTALYEEVEEAGFDKKTFKRVIKARKQSRAERENEQAKFDFYMGIVGDAA